MITSTNAVISWLYSKAFVVDCKPNCIRPKFALLLCIRPRPMSKNLTFYVGQFGQFKCWFFLTQYYVQLCFTCCV